MTNIYNSIQDSVKELKKSIQLAMQTYYKELSKFSENDLLIILRLKSESDYSPFEINILKHLCLRKYINSDYQDEIFHKIKRLHTSHNHIVEDYCIKLFENFSSVENLTNLSIRDLSEYITSCA